MGKLDARGLGSTFNNLFISLLNNMFLIVFLSTVVISIHYTLCGTMMIKSEVVNAKRHIVAWIIVCRMSYNFT